MADVTHGGSGGRSRDTLTAKFAPAWRARPVERVAALMPAATIVIGGLTFPAIDLFS